MSKSKRSRTSSMGPGAVLLAVLLIALIGVPATLAVFNRPAGTHHTLPAKAAKTDLSPDAGASPYARYEQLERAFDRVTRADEEGRRLLAFYRQHADHGLLLEQSDLAILKNRSGNGTFLVISASLEERRAKGIRSRSVLDNQWVFEDGTGVMYVPDPSEYSEIVLGVVFAHELVHVHDLVTGVEVPHTGRDAWLDGEVRAYQLEFRLLDAATGGAFLQEARRILDARPEFVAAFKEGRPVFPSRQDMLRLEGTLPSAASSRERDVRNALVTFALMFEALKRLDAPRDRYRQALELLY